MGVTWTAFEAMILAAEKKLIGVLIFVCAYGNKGGVENQIKY